MLQKGTELLTHKAERPGGEVRQVFPNYTSQICSACGQNVPKTLAQRISPVRLQLCDRSGLN
jgi:transposase